MASTDSAPRPGSSPREVSERGRGAGPYVREDFLDALVRWMAAELVADEHARLDGARFASEAKIPLADVYVDLPVRIPPLAARSSGPLPSEDGAGLIAWVCRHDVEGVRWREAATYERDEPTVRTESLRRVVVIGGPGQGKSTAAQFITQTHRAAWLSLPTVELSARARAALDRVLRRSELAPARVRFPLRVSLPAFMGWISRHEDPDLPRTLDAYLCARARAHGVTIVAEDLLRWARVVPWLLVLDGFDEVADRDDRDTLDEALDAFERALDGSDGVTLVLTRPQGYDRRDERAVHVELQPLSPELSLGYATRLVEGWFPEDPDARERLRGRLRTAADDPGTVRLMQSPLQVTILAALLHRIPRAPRERWRLFRAYFDTLYERETDRPVPSARVLADYRTLIESIHWQIGLFLQMRAEAKGGSDPSLSSDELHVVVEAKVAEAGYAAAPRAAITDAIEVAARQRLVFLVETTPGRYGFELRSLQEFAAAEALMVGRDAPVAERLKAIAPSHPWRNVLLFAMSRVFSVPGELRDSLTADVCRWLNRDSSTLDASRYEGSHLAARVLDEEMASRSPRSVHALLEVVLDALSSRFHLEAEMIVKAALKVAEDPDLRDDAQALVRARVESSLAAPPSEAPVAWDVAHRLYEKGYEWAKSARLAHWPASREERYQEALIRSAHGNYAWFGGEAGEHIESLQLEIERLRYGGRPESFDDWRLRMWPAWEAHRARRFLNNALLYWADLPWTDDRRRLPSPEKIKAEDDRAKYGALLAFLREPGVNTLADAVAAVVRMGVRAWRGTTHNVPWQLGACIDAIDAGEDPDVLIERIRSGALGNLSDWERATERWRDGTVTPDEFLAFSEEECLFGPSLAQVGLPPVEVNFFGSHDEALEVTRALWARAQDARPWIQRLCVRRLLRVIEGLNEPRIGGDVIPPAQFVALLAKHGLTTQLQFLQHLTDATTAEGLAALLEAVDAPDISPAVDDWGIPDGETLVRAWSLCPHNHRAPRIMARSFYRDPPRSRPSPSLFTDIPDADDRTRAAQFSLRYNAGGVTPAEVQEFLPLLHRVAREEPGLLTFCTETQVTGRNSAVAFPLILGLWSHLPYGWLRARYDRHPLTDWCYRSTLLDEASFRALGLPVPPWAATLNDALTPLADEPVEPLVGLTVDGLRTFRSLPLPILPVALARDGTAPWVILLGENGVGKTTLLRALAFALADHKTASAALAKSAAPYCRDRATPAKISVRIGPKTFGAEIVAETRGERVDPSGADERPFVVAYGCRRGSAFGGADRAVNIEPAYDIATLFEETAEGLVHAESWLKDLDRRALRDPHGEGGRTRDAVLAVLCGNRDRPGLLPGVRDVLFDRDPDHLVVVGDAIGEAPLSALSDGYLTMMGWTIDLLARWIHRQRARGLSIPRGFNRVMTGVVLIDEVDMHLHPRWQYDVIRTVREHFPRMVFVATTHNPMTILRARPGELFVLRREPDGEVSARQLDVPPGVRADEILTGPWFGMVSTTDPGTLALFEEHQRLLREGRAHDDPAVASLAAGLRERLGRFGDTAIERMVLAVLASLRPSMNAQPSPEERAQMRDRAVEILRKRRETKGGGPP